MNAIVSRDTPLDNPWLWMATGACLILVAAIVSLVSSGGDLLLGLFVVGGCLLVGIAVAIRLNSSAPSRIAPSLRPMTLLALTVFQFLSAALVTWSLLAAFAGVDPLAPGRDEFGNPPPLRPGLAILLWVLIVPMAVNGAYRTVQSISRPPGDGDVANETSAILMTAAIAALIGGFALAVRADTLAFFLSVTTALLSAGVSVVVLSPMFRRIILSAAIALHFGFIINATLAAPPTSWLLGQLWTRFSRPYLEFMYLNNAYHFYSPDPGPASYLWFRLYYDTGEVDPKTGEPKLDAHWLKIPNIDANGNHAYRVALEYQRHLSLTENSTGSETTPALYFRAPDGKAMPAPFFASRIINSPDGAVLQGEVIGEKKPSFVMSVPFHQFIPNENQFQKPTLATSRTLESYVRHVSRTPHPTRPQWPLHSVRVYRVTHVIPPWNVFVAGMEPQDPEFYRPYYLGRYDAEGKLMDPNEPLLYWLLPILRENATMPNSPIRSYAAMHANDPYYMYVPTRKQWVTEQEVGK